MNYTYRLSQKGISQTTIKAPVDPDVDSLTNIPLSVNLTDAFLYRTGKKENKDPFSSYLTGKAPSICQDLGVETIDGISVQKFIFHSREYLSPVGKDSIRIFGVIARPEKSGVIRDYWCCMEVVELQRSKKQGSGQLTAM